VQVVNVSTSRNLSYYLKSWDARYGDGEEFNQVSFSVGERSVQGPIVTNEPVKSIRSAHRPEFLSRIGIMEIDKPGTYTAMLAADFINSRDPDGIVMYEVRLQKLN
jgi:hypothetical protein